MNRCSARLTRERSPAHRAARVGRPLFASLVVVGLAAPAAAVLWDGGGVSSEWTEPANWQFNVLPTTADTATITNDTATITGVVAPTVFAVELGLGTMSGGLVIAGGVNPGRLNVVTNVAVAGAGSLTLGGGGPATSQVMAATLTTSGALSVLSRGTVNLSGQLTQIAGTANLSGGTINAATVLSRAGIFNATGQVNGDVSIGDGNGAIATLAPGALLDVNGDMKLASDARLEIQFRPLTGGGGAFDMIDVSETFTLGGTLDLSALGGAAPTPGVIYSVLKAGDLRGEFDDIVGSAVGDGSWVPHFDLGLTNGVTFSYTELRGNMNADKTVDELDVELFAHAIRDSNSYHIQFYLQGSAADAFMADMDGDGGNTFADIPLFLDAIEQFGGDAPAALAGIMRVLTVVPEPNAAIMAWGTALIVGSKLRRNHCSRGSPE